MINAVLNVILLSITVYTVVIGFLSFWFMIRMRLVLREHAKGSEILSQMVSSIFNSINEKERSIVDLMYRMDLLEAAVKRQKTNFGAEQNVMVRDVKRDVTSSNVTRGQGGVSEAEFRLLSSLKEGSRKVSEITVSMGKSREHTSRMLGRLVQRGLLERLNTGVGVMYALTDAGKGLVM